MDRIRIAPEHRGAVPRTRTFALRASSTTSEGSTEISGHAVVWGSLNSHGEVFVPGAFADETSDVRENPLTMVWMHECPIGRWSSVTEDAKGLALNGKISDTSLGRDAATLVNDEAVNGLSIGFWPVEYVFAEPGETVSFETPFGRFTSTTNEWTVYITKAELAETSIVYAPSDDLARIDRDRDELLTKAERALPGLRDAASWEDVAYSMALICGGRGAAAFTDLADVEHRKLFARVADAYARFDREAPAYARFPEYAQIEFRHDERGVFHDRYLRKSLAQVAAGVSGVEGPLSPETRTTAEEVVASLQLALGRRSPEEQLAELRASVDALTRSLQPTPESQEG